MVDMIKMKIGNKLIITYFLVLLVAFIITTVAFNYLSRVYLIQETKEQLRIEGRNIAETLKRLNLDDGTIRENLLKRQSLKIAGRFIDSDIIVLNKDRRIIYKDVKDLEPRTLVRLVRNGQLSIRGYVSEITPVFDKNGKIRAYIILFTKIKNINELNNIYKRARTISFTIAGIIAFIVGIFFTKSISGPIKRLSSRMNNFSIKNTKEYEDIKTGDEIEDLDKSFKRMAKKIRKYDEQQRRFFQNTSHELKTPLMSIQGYAEAIKDGIVEGKELEESLDIIIAESQRLKKLVDELVYLSKLENVEEGFSFRKVNLMEIIEKAVKSVRPLAEEKGIAIKIEGMASILGMYDTDKLVRGLINILGNGVRYANSEIIITIKEGIEEVEVLVIDDGPGFKNGEEKKVFDRLYKGDKGNTGLGLSITKAIIEGHNGKIIAFNSTQKGAVFKIVLPKELNEYKD